MAVGASARTLLHWNESIRHLIFSQPAFFVVRTMPIMLHLFVPVFLLMISASVLIRSRTLVPPLFDGMQIVFGDEMGLAIDLDG